MTPPLPSWRLVGLALLTALGVARACCTTPVEAQDDALVRDVVQLAFHESTDPLADAPGIHAVVVNGAARRGMSTHAFARWHSRRFFAGQTARPWWRELALDCSRPRGYRGRWEEPAREGALSLRDTCVVTVALVRSLREPVCDAVWWGSREDYSGGPHAEAHRRDVFVACAVGGRAPRNLFSRGPR